MKRTVFAIVSFMLAVCLLQGCSSAKSGDGLFYNPSMGYYDEAEAPSYSYDEVKENGFTVAAVKNSSTFSLDRNTTGYSIARRQINGGTKISADSVRVEEYVNYFSYSYPEPTDGKPLAISGKLFDCPWNAENKLFTVGVSAKQIDFTDKKQNNLVFLIDVSGSMFGSDRLGLIQNAFTMLANNLADDDVVSIVTYAGSTKVVAEGLNGTQKSQICNVLQDLSASGSTAGGLKTVTLGVVVLAAVGTARGRSRASVFRHTIPQEKVSQAMTLFMLMLTLAFVGAALICACSGCSLSTALYETVSALATVGLTAGLTATLTTLPKLLLIVFMFFGRVGIMTISIGFLTASRAEDRFEYAPARMLIG